jgi:hypothetical protein
MIAATETRRANNVDQVVMALLDARFNCREITPRLDAVLAALNIKAA